jgi:hypothetical protein
MPSFLEEMTREYYIAEGEIWWCVRLILYVVLHSTLQRLDAPVAHIALKINFFASKPLYGTAAYTIL